MNLAEALAKGSPLLLDGAMGTQLAEAGLEMGGHNCLTHPQQVQSVHERYAMAGCDILLTNTLTMNRIYIESHSVAANVREVNLAGAALARAAAGAERYVLGDVSSTGQLLEPYGDCTEDQVTDSLKEQAEYLAEGGVDGFMVETMLDLREAVCAVRACMSVAELPVIASLAFQTTERGGRTVMGNTAADCAKSLAGVGAASVGANCGDLDPSQMAAIVTMMKEVVPLPILVQPNAGQPTLVDGETVFGMEPEPFAKGIDECLQAGATLIGGCCGTSPEHLCLVAAHMDKSAGPGPRTRGEG